MSTPRSKPAHQMKQQPGKTRQTGPRQAELLKGSAAAARTMGIPREHKPKGGSKGPNTGNPDQEMQRNADLYVASLLDPAKYQGVRVPDLLSYPTSVTTFRSRLTFSSSQTEWTQQFFQPQLITSATVPWNFRLQRVSAAGVYPAFGAGSADTVNLATATTNFAAMRTASWVAKIMPTGPLLDREGTIGVLRVLYPDVLPTASAGLSSNPLYCEVAISSPAMADGLEMSWRPQSYVQGLDFRPPTQGASLGGVLFEVPPTPTAAQAFLVEIIHNVEFVAKDSNQSLFDSASAPGAESDVAKAWLKAETLAGDPQGQTTAEWSRLLKGAASRLAQHGLEQVVRRGTRALSGYFDSTMSHGGELEPRLSPLAASDLGRAASAAAAAGTTAAWTLLRR